MATQIYGYIWKISGLNDTFLKTKNGFPLRGMRGSTEKMTMGEIRGASLSLCGKQSLDNFVLTPNEQA